MSLDEFQLISRFFSSQETSCAGSICADSSVGIKAKGEPHLEIGIGDDAAVMAGLDNHQLAVSVDTLVESVHFPTAANPELLARRALRVNLSDMAAMGAQPQWFTLALTLPECDENWLQGFSRGLQLDAKEFGCQLIGGDTTRGPMNIGIQIMGTISESRAPMTRSGAKPADLLVVTGTLGNAGAALQFDLNTFDPKKDTPGKLFLQSYWLPEPRTRFALDAAKYAHAACDISDGLAADVGHLCKQSHLSAIINLNEIPVSSELASHEPMAKINALTAGDDYELCMAVPEKHLASLGSVAESYALGVSVVGRFEQSQTDKHQVNIVDHHGDRLEIKNTGYTHF